MEAAIGTKDKNKGSHTLNLTHSEHSSLGFWNACTRLGGQRLYMYWLVGCSPAGYRLVLGCIGVGCVSALPRVARAQCPSPVAAQFGISNRPRARLPCTRTSALTSPRPFQDPEHLASKARSAALPLRRDAYAHVRLFVYCLCNSLRPPGHGWIRGHVLGAPHMP